MTHEEINAWVMAISAVVISAWVAMGLLTEGLAATTQDAAIALLWAIGYTILFNIIAAITGVIVVTIVHREEVRDERANERDRLVNNARAMRNAYFVLSRAICYRIG